MIRCAGCDGKVFRVGTSFYGDKSVEAPILECDNCGLYHFSDIFNAVYMTIAFDKKKEYKSAVKFGLEEIR